MAGPSLQPISLAALQPNPKVSSGCDVLDQFLSGGIPTGMITEFVGERADLMSPASGRHAWRTCNLPHYLGAGESTAAKSQLCMQMLLAVQLPTEFGGLGGSAV